MDAFYQIEALISLANFAHVNPHYTFPELIAVDPNTKVFSAEAMGHPLIADEKKVRNNFNFETLGNVSIITGSNMTGKSTFLRTVGINLRLAYAGGPVDAQRMTVCLFRVMSSIRISDSLAEEMSYFYAEVRRLKKILIALEEKDDQPVFFLIDEILKGTNNIERYLGSKPYIRAISGKHGVGLVTTHDLKLNKLAEHLALISNLHFGDAINNGKFVFDYKLRSGPSTSTNALKILESEGFPIDD
jgi:DNA mismatch repair ATPase MutS